MIKLICYNNNVSIIPNHYGKNIAAIQELVNIAKTDFPFLQDNDILVQTYGGSRYKNQVRIEFNVPYPFIIPSDYIQSDYLSELK